MLKKHQRKLARRSMDRTVDTDHSRLAKLNKIIGRADSCSFVSVGEPFVNKLISLVNEHE